MPSLKSSSPWDTPPCPAPTLVPLTITTTWPHCSWQVTWREGR